MTCGQRSQSRAANSTRRPSAFPGSFLLWEVFGEVPQRRGRIWAVGIDGIAGRRYSSPTTADATAAPRGGASDLPFSGQLDVSSSPFDEVTHIADRPGSGG